MRAGSAIAMVVLLSAGTATALGDGSSPPARGSQADPSAAVAAEGAQGPSGRPSGAASGAEPSGDADARPDEAGTLAESEGRAESEEIDALVSEFIATGDAVAGRADGERKVRFSGPPERPDWYQALVVTHRENPLLEEECKKEALSISVAKLRETHGIEGGSEALRKAAAHMREHQEFASSHDISYADYLREISECRSFCAPLIASLMRCQVLAVSRSPHGVVLFGVDSTDVHPRYAEGIVARVAGMLREDASRRAVLVGRASRIGDLRYNRRLSARRALSVRDSLIERGAPADRIKTMWFGWEPPQISEWVAARYGIQELYERRGPQAVNQSVLLAIYGVDDAPEEGPSDEPGSPDHEVSTARVAPEMDPR